VAAPSGACILLKMSGPFTFARAAIRSATTRLSRAGKRVLLLATAILSLSAASPGAAQAPTANQFQIEAVFLFNFTQFVSWPASAFAGAADPFVICVLGEDPFDGYLDDTVRGERVGERSLVVRRYRHIEEIDVCHVLFISKSENSKLSQILVQLAGRGVLSVSDADHFGKRGGMVRFVVEQNRVRLRVNVEAAKAAGLTFSSKLLRVVDIVDTDKD